MPFPCLPGVQFLPHALMHFPFFLPNSPPLIPYIYAVDYLFPLDKNLGFQEEHLPLYLPALAYISHLI